MALEKSKRDQQLICALLHLTIMEDIMNNVTVYKIVSLSRLSSHDPQNAIAILICLLKEKHCPKKLLCKNWPIIVYCMY